MPLPSPPNPAASAAWHRDNSLREVTTWWCIKAPNGPKILARVQIDAWVATTWAGMSDARQLQIAQTMIDSKTAAWVARGRPNAVMEARWHFGGWSVDRMRSNTCDCILVNCRPRPPAAAAFAEWMATDVQCPEHAVHASGDELHTAVVTESQRASITGQIIRTHFGLDPGVELPTGVTISVEGASSVAGRTVFVDGLTGRDATDIEAALDGEFGVGVLVVR